MIAATQPQPVDQSQRDAAVCERQRNVVLQAGAGTGKTSTLVRRLVQLVAPHNDGTPLSMGRIAAITFTRRAAGELSLRIRQELLKGLIDPATTEVRQGLIRLALTELDTAYVGTIHSFADRLLRMRPVESRLSPTYQVVEDEQELIEETYQLLLRGAEQGTLASSLAGSGVLDLADEAAQTVMDVLRVGIRAQTQETGFAPSLGLDALVKGFIMQRDVAPVQGPVPVPDLTRTRQYMQEFIDLVEPLTDASDVGDWARGMARNMAGWMTETDPLVLFAELAPRLDERRRQTTTKKHSCNGDKDVWRLWKGLIEGMKNRDASDVPLADDLTATLRAWLGGRLVRLSPVLVALYEKVKARRGVIDQIDLLLKLRDLLRDNLTARGFYQELFDHIMVDEFQDTDPLQAEVVQFLCEKVPLATAAHDVVLASGKLTLVGDPKQSIYRFRRADVEMYDRVTHKLGDEALRVELTANFRSVPGMIDWFNARFPELLGLPIKDETFEPGTGRVFHRDLGRGRVDDRTSAVHVLPFELDTDKPSSDGYRELESEALAFYLRWLVEESGETIVPKGSSTPRPLCYADICLLAMATTKLSMLFAQLDHMDVPYAASGGKLFLDDPLQRQFILGLRAIADVDDGVAQAALLRPPFFATDLRDLFESKGTQLHGEGPGGPGRERVQETMAWIESLRQRRLTQSPGATARELLEGTGLGRTVALGPNGGQRLQRLREICHLLAVQAVESGLDYDGITAHLRQWVTEPAKLDAPRPVAEDAMQVMTVHQAKGLEFPVVVLWDGRAMLAGGSAPVAWKVAQGGKAWSLSLAGLQVSEPPDIDLTVREKLYLDEERRRLVYVAATRARDLIVIPQAGQPNPRYVCGLLLSGQATAGVKVLPAYAQGKGAAWSAAVQARVAPQAESAGQLEQQVQAAWAKASVAAGAARFRPVGVSQWAHEQAAEPASAAADAETEEQQENEERWKDRDRQGRFGPVFGTVVHRALEICLRDAQVTARDAVYGAAQEVGLMAHLPEAVQDVARGLGALEQHGLLGLVGESMRLEYPVSGPGEGGLVLLGYVDLVRVDGNVFTVIDFKTDQPPQQDVAAELPGYVAQVQMYARLLRLGGVGDAAVKCGLLFTADGGLRWV